jgi:hypothetical protein
MIQYDKDGVTLFYIDASGKKISHNFMEGTAYDDMVNVRSAQLQAVTENTQAAANYNTALANVQVSVDAGRPYDAAPAKPLQKAVSDTGDVSYAPFVPPLPDLTLPQTIPSGPVVTPTLDKQAIIYNMILAMFRKTFPDA